MADPYWVIYNNEELFESPLILKSFCHGAATPVTKQPLTVFTYQSHVPLSKC